MQERILIIGTGGFAREVLWLIREIQQTGTGPEIIGLVAEKPGFPPEIAGIPVIGTDDALFASADRSYRFVVANGNPHVRLRIAQVYENHGFVAASALRHPSVLMGTGTTAGQGTILCAGSILTTDIRVANHVLINLQCSIGHDCILETGATLHPGVRLSGTVHLGEATELGTGAMVLPGLPMAPHVRVGAGAVVTRPLMEAGTYVGVPARKKDY